MAVLADVASVILTDNGLSDTAARMALLVASKGEGWHEIPPAEFARSVAGYPSAEKVARHLKQLEVAGYVERRAGGRGHSDYFRLTLDPACIPSLKSDRSGVDTGPKVLDPPYIPGLNAPIAVAEADSSNTPLNPPAELDERTERAIDQHAGILAGCRGALRDYLIDYVPEPRKRNAFVQLIAGWLNGIDPNVWRLPDGSMLPPEERPPALALALNDLGASTRDMKAPQGDPANLRTKLNIHLKQRKDHERDGTEGRTNGGRSSAPRRGDPPAKPERRNSWGADLDAAS